MKNMSYFWKKKEIVSYILSILVFLIHITSLAVYNNVGSRDIVFNEFIRFFFIRSLPRFAVPLFFIISGTLFYRDYSHRNYFKKIKSRVKSLLIPYLSWNTIWLIFVIVTSHTFIADYFIGRDIFEITIPNIFEAIFHYSCNTPFWFVFELMFFVLISPGIYYLVKYKWMGLVFSAAVLIINYFLEIPSTVFYSCDAIVFFIVGGIMGMHYFDCFIKKSSKKSAFAALGVFCASILLFFVINFLKIEIDEAIKDLYMLIPAFSFWCAMDLVVDKMNERSFYKNSFAVYAMHINVQSVVCKIFYLLLPKNPYVAPVNFVLTLTFTLLIINMFCYLLRRYLPKVHSIIMGSR